MKQREMGENGQSGEEGSGQVDTSGVTGAQTYRSTAVYYREG